MILLIVVSALVQVNWRFLDFDISFTNLALWCKRRDLRGKEITSLCQRDIGR